MIKHESYHGGCQSLLFHADIRSMHHVIEQASVDVILTDPPYPQEFLPCWEYLAHFADYALKPGGHLFAMSGHVWLPEVFAALGKAKETRYNWCLNMGPLTHGAHTNIGRRIIRNRWKPILWYVKPPHSVHEQMSDNVRVSARDKRFHHWGQDIGCWRYILDCLKRPKPALICDPFLGGGTSAVVCAEEGYAFVGNDIDPECITTTIGRLNTLQPRLFIGSDLHDNTQPEASVHQQNLDGQTLAQ